MTVMMIKWKTFILMLAIYVKHLIIGNGTCLCITHAAYGETEEV